MSRSVRRQSWRIFMILAVAGGLFLGGMGITLIASGAVTAGAVILFMGLVLIALMALLFKSFVNTNAGKSDKSVEVNYLMQSDSGAEALQNIDALKNRLNTLKQGQEILITLTSEYIGLVSWRFIKIKGMYLSFVTLRKKDKTQEFFTMPRPDVDNAAKPFADVFVEKKAVDTRNLIEMKRYRAVLEYYKLA